MVAGNSFPKLSMAFSRADYDSDALAVYLICSASTRKLRKLLGEKSELGGTAGGSSDHTFVGEPTPYEELSKPFTESFISEREQTLTSLVVADIKTPIPKLACSTWKLSRSSKAWHILEAEHHEMLRPARHDRNLITSMNDCLNMGGTLRIQVHQAKRIRGDSAIGNVDS